MTMWAAFVAGDSDDEEQVLAGYAAAQTQAAATARRLEQDDQDNFCSSDFALDPMAGVVYAQVR